MEELGRIISVIDKDFALVEIKGSSACKSCNICQLGKEGQRFAKVKNIISAKVGNLVRIEIEGREIAKASFVVYLFPLILMLLGIFLGYKLTTILNIGEYQDILLSISSIFSLILAFTIIRIYNKKIVKESKLIPVIKEIVDES
jgi:sigma-E factor negative regulatory protein RseC